MEEKKMERLYQLLSEATDADVASALRWAIFNLENQRMYNTQEMVSKNFESCGGVGSKIYINLNDMGIFTATIHEITNEGMLFIFDQIVTFRPMNRSQTNTGGFKESELYRWLQEQLLPLFPKDLKKHIQELTIPTLGQIIGHNDSWSEEYIESDNDEQLPLMKNGGYLIAPFGGEMPWYWLRNTTKSSYSSAFFAYVSYDGFLSYGNASYSIGVRPEFWFIIEK